MHWDLVLGTWDLALCKLLSEVPLQTPEGLEHFRVAEIRIPATRVRQDEQPGAVDGFGPEAENVVG